jgi:predicted nucleotidyltransferase
MFKYLKHLKVIMSPIHQSRKEAIIEYILDNPNARIRVNDIARKLGVSKGSVSLTLKKLVEEGFVTDLHVNMDNPEVRTFKILINIRSIMNKGVISRLKRYALGAGLYGSWAKGTNTEDSDIDLWIIPKKSFRQADIAEISGKIREILGVDTQILVLSKERIERLKRDNTVFYHSLLFSSMQLYGEEVE